MDFGNLSSLVDLNKNNSVINLGKNDTVYANNVLNLLMGGGEERLFKKFSWAIWLEFRCRL